MKITETKIFPLKDNGKSKVRAFASITFDKTFVVSGIRIVEGGKGLFISFPQTLGSDKEYHDVAFPITAEARKKISDIVLEAYESHNEGDDTVNL